MNKSSLRTAIIILTVITALVHLSLNFMGFDVLFTLNGIGYFVLLFAFLGRLPIKFSKDLVYWGFIGFTVVTIIMFFVFNGSGTLGYLTKVDEVLLVVALLMHGKE
jgi:hypothetical protein